MFLVLWQGICCRGSGSRASVLRIFIHDDLLELTGLKNRVLSAQVSAKIMKETLSKRACETDNDVVHSDRTKPKH